MTAPVSQLVAARLTTAEARALQAASHRAEARAHRLEGEHDMAERKERFAVDYDLMAASYFRIADELRGAERVEQ